MPPVTQKQIAAALGLSQATVAAVLGNIPGIRMSAATRQRVLTAVARSGYRPARHARLMRGARSGLLGLLQYGGVPPTAGHSAALATQALLAGGYETVAGSVDWDGTGQPQALRTLLDLRVEGLLLLDPARSIPAETLGLFKAQRIPIAAVNGWVVPEVVQQRADVFRGMHALARHVLETGRRRLVLLTFWPDSSRAEASCWPTLERVAGFRAGFTEAKAALGCTATLQEIIWKSIPSGGDACCRMGEDALAGLLQWNSRPDAVICHNDSVAQGALKACAARGLRVPEDLAITGFGAEPASGYGWVPLTSVAEPTEELVTQAVARLLAMVRAGKVFDEPQITRHACRLVIRASSHRPTEWVGKK